MAGIASTDPHALNRFLAAQKGSYETALAELQSGAKRSHWMWFVFPQLRGLGRSEMAWHYGIADLDEAGRYHAHDVLGPRLVACGATLLDHPDRSAKDIFGPVDAAKLRSSATLFAALDGADPVFERILATFFDGRPCPRTTDRLR